MTGEVSARKTNMKNCLPIAIFISSKYSSIGKISMTMVSDAGRGCDFKGIQSNNIAELDFRFII